MATPTDQVGGECGGFSAATDINREDFGLISNVAAAPSSWTLVPDVEKMPRRSASTCDLIVWLCRATSDRPWLPAVSPEAFTAANTKRWCYSTRSRTRRWHSYEMCGNRTNVAAHRARTARGGSGGSGVFGG
ncbi:MAG: zinc finger protein [Pseudonocardiales bacterium]|nr:zinc finger protein [Pseudonocardiales bacterium]